MLIVACISAVVSGLSILGSAMTAAGEVSGAGLVPAGSIALSSVGYTTYRWSRRGHSPRQPSENHVYKKLAILSLLFAACGQGSGSPKSSSANKVVVPGGVDVASEHQPAAPAEGGTVVRPEVGRLLAVLTPGAVQLFDPTSGKNRPSCSVGGSQPIRINGTSIVYLGADGRALLTCDLETGAHRALASLALGRHGAIPRKVQLSASQDGERICAKLSGPRGVQRGDLASDEVVGGWATLDLDGEVLNYSLRRARDRQRLPPPWRCNGPKLRPFEPLPLPPVIGESGYQPDPILRTDNGDWILLRGLDGRSDSSKLGSAVLVMRAESRQVYPVSVGSWPPPIEPGTKAVADIESSTYVVPYGMPGFTSCGGSCFVVGSLLVIPGRSSARMAGEVASPVDKGVPYMYRF